MLQLEKVSRLVLARRVPLLPGAGTVAFVDIDSMQKRVYGRQKLGAASGHTKIQGKSLLVRGLNALAATISTPLAAPVIAATRLRGGSANPARGVQWDAGTARGQGHDSFVNSALAVVAKFYIDVIQHIKPWLPLRRRRGTDTAQDQPVRRVDLPEASGLQENPDGNFQGSGHSQAPASLPKLSHTESAGTS